MHMRVRIFMAWHLRRRDSMAGSVRNASLLPRARGVMLVAAMDRRVVIVAVPEVQPLNVTGPAEVFAGAATAVARAGGAGYAVEVVAAGGGAVATGSGYALLASGALEDVRAPLDTLVVAGGRGRRNAARAAAAVAGRSAGG